MSNRAVEKGRVLLVSGPASVELVEGKAIVLGAYMSEGKKVVVRKGRVLPFEAEEDSVLDIFLSVDANVEEVAGSTIPESWVGVVEKVLAQPKPCTALVMGDVDRRKTTFCTFLANRALAWGLETAVVDADLGQSNIGPPATISLSLVSEPVTDLFSLEPRAVLFVGLTSPSGVTERVVEGLASLQKHLCEAEASFAVINTDGWVQGAAARDYKLALLRRLRPSTVIGLQESDELEHILKPAEEEGFRVLRLTSSPSVKKRNRETRRELREQGYRKFLRDARMRSLPMNWLQFEYTPLGSGVPLDSGRLRKLEGAIGLRVLYCEENPEELFVELVEGTRVGSESIAKAEEIFGKRLRVVSEGDEKGLLVGLLDRDHRFLGLGVIHKIDYRSRTLRLFTPYKDRIDIIQFGQVRVDRHGRELGVTRLFSTPG